MIFVCHSPSQLWTSQYWSCKSQVSVLDIKLLVLVFGPQVLVLVLDKQVLNPNLYFKQLKFYSDDEWVNHYVKIMKSGSKIIL